MLLPFPLLLLLHLLLVVNQLPSLLRGKLLLFPHLVPSLWDKLSMEDIKLVPELLMMRLEYIKLVLRDKLQQVMPLLLLFMMLLVRMQVINSAGHLFFYDWGICLHYNSEATRAQLLILVLLVQLTLLNLLMLVILGQSKGSGTIYVVMSLDQWQR